MNPIFKSPTFRNLLDELKSQPAGESTDDWPGRQLAAMAEAGVTTWDIPEEFGGIDLSPGDMLDGLRLLSAECLASTFILTQRSAAVRRIATSNNIAAKKLLLPALLNGQIFATVGISHLTTSGQHLQQPLVQAEQVEDGFVLNGTVPWATGATQADRLITGGTLYDGRQILAAVLTDQSGVDVQPPANLMALNASQTGAVRLTDVRVPQADLLHGPVTGVMKQGTGGGAGSLGTSALAVGVTSGILTHMSHETERRPELKEFLSPLQNECDQLTSQIQRCAHGSDPSGPSGAMESIRQKANSLVLRAAQSWLAATKGAGYVAGHPAERAVRESMFFLVWSCPQPVLHANLKELACHQGLRP